MKVKELREILNGFDDNLEVTFADYSDDRDEYLHCNEIEGVEKLECKSHKELVVIYRTDSMKKTCTSPVE
jgi:hypothetical protein